MKRKWTDKPKFNAIVFYKRHHPQHEAQIVKFVGTERIQDAYGNMYKIGDINLVNQNNRDRQTTMYCLKTLNEENWFYLKCYNDYDVVHFLANGDEEEKVLKYFDCEVNVVQDEFRGLGIRDDNLSFVVE